VGSAETKGGGRTVGGTNRLRFDDNGGDGRSGARCNGLTGWSRTVKIQWAALFLWAGPINYSKDFPNYQTDSNLQNMKMVLSEF
jgi:hypothetical protein